MTNSNVVLFPTANEYGVKTKFNGAENRDEILFPNGWKISVIWGAGTYSDNYNSRDWEVQLPYPQWGKVEAAVLNPEGEVFYGDYYDVFGYVTPQWIRASLVPAVSKLDKGEEVSLYEIAYEE